MDLLASPALAALALLIGVYGTAPASAQDSDSPVTFALRIADGRREFKQGEIIPLELEFSSSIPDRYVVDAATYDRSGRLSLDTFRVEPIRGVSDPLLDYFGASRGFIGGGIRTSPALGPTPVRVRLDLNDWFRFDRPGTYRLSATSRRVHANSDLRSMVRPLTLQSNVITFTVLRPDARWQASELTSALRVIDSAEPGLDRRAACRRLRFLGTTAAVAGMIKRFDETRGCEFDYDAGLFAAPDRASVVAQMERALGTKPAPVSESYLRTLAILSVYVSHPELRPVQSVSAIGGPPTPGPLSQRPELVNTALAKYARPREGDPASRFHEHSSERQLALLRDQWPSLRDQPNMLAIVRELAGKAGLPALADIALQRLYELAPEEGRALILQEIQNPRAASLATLGLLPDRELPQFDEALVANLVAGRVNQDVAAGLIQRYASAAVSQNIRSYLEPAIGRLACRPQAALIGYFVRVDESFAKVLLERALASRGPTGCYRRVLAEVGRADSTVLQAFAIEHLSDEKPSVVDSAIEVLGRSETASNRAVLLEFFRRWHAEWQGREAEMIHPAVPGEPSRGILELTLIRALLRGQPTEDLRRELQALCVTETCRIDARIRVPIK